MANLEAFFRAIKLSINLLFLKSDFSSQTKYSSDKKFIHMYSFISFFLGKMHNQPTAKKYELFGGVVTGSSGMIKHNSKLFLESSQKCITLSQAVIQKRKRNKKQK